MSNRKTTIAAQDLGVARAALDLTQELLQSKAVNLNYQGNYHQLSAVENDLYELEAEYEAARLLTLKASWMADNKQPNSKNAAMSKAKAGRIAVQISLKCVELGVSWPISSIAGKIFSQLKKSSISTRACSRFSN
jgi:acyl-CoA dehydrogenase